MATIQSLENSTPPVSSWLPIYLVAGGIILLTFASRLWMLQIREFDQDEFAHFHDAWCISRGMLPYRDFWEHHVPLLHLSFAPFVPFFEPDKSLAGAVGLLFFGRRMMWVFLAGILLLTAWLGRLWRSWRVAAIGTILLVNTEIFLNETMEFRPDVLSTFFWLACLALLVHTLRLEAPGNSRPRTHFFLSGVCLGAGMMSTQKLLVGMPGFALALLWYLFRYTGPFRTKLTNTFLLFVGFLLPVATMMAYFYSEHSLWRFVHCNFLFAFAFKAKATPYRGLLALVIQNPYLIFFGSLALAAFLIAVSRRMPLKPEDAILFPSAMGFILGLWLIPAPFDHYYLTFLPLLSLFAADSLIRLFERLCSMRTIMPVRTWVYSVLKISVPVLVLLSVVCRPHVAAFWFAGFVIALLALYFRGPTLALIVFALAISVPPQVRTHASLKLRNNYQIEQIRYVHENTAPHETVMDGFSGIGLFRPHAYYYFMLDWSVALMLAKKDWDELFEALQSGRISPKLVILDREWEQPAIPRRIVDYLLRNYEPVGVGAIWRRKLKPESKDADVPPSSTAQETGSNSASEFPETAALLSFD